MANFLALYSLNKSYNSYDGELHDFYNVYVNGDYVGKKVVFNEIEKITDIENYLHQNKFNDFGSKIDENSLYIIEDDVNKSKELKETLNIYLNLK